MTSNICPLCKKECCTVGANKVYSSIKPHFRKHVKSSTYGYCTNIDCDVAYFGTDNDEIYFKRDFEDDVK